jgi:hypothetical protein
MEEPNRLAMDGQDDGARSTALDFLLEISPQATAATRIHLAQSSEVSGVD